ncbi:MAG: glycosyltransferase family 39 protein [Candidatus Gottesmanbacteria bacterium]
MFSKWIIFIVIILSAFILRFYAIDRIPPSLSWDEVSIGYNAYSILRTGLDEHGKFLPIDAFAGYGDYKPPLSIYLTIPFVVIFGLTEVSVRFPSALFGTLTVLMTFFLVRALFYKSKSATLPLLSSALFAISPWHINLSRAGFEANIALFFIVLGVWLVLKAREQKNYWFFAWIPFALSMYTFNSARYFVVFIGIALFIYSFSSIKKHIVPFLFGLGVAAIIVFPLVPHLLSKEARLRFVEVNIFTDASVVKTANERIERGKNSILATVLNNRRIGYARSYLLHFFDNLQPDFLFIKGDGNPKFSIQDVGQLYIMEAPFLAIGILSLFVAHPSVGALLLFWLLASIIPAATARETPHALRILNSLPTWQIFIAFGIVTCGTKMKEWSKKIKLSVPVFVFVLIGLYVFSITYYLHNYYRHYGVEYSGEWQYGYREAIAASEKIKDRYDTIVMSETIGRPYMYTLFYTKTDPKELLRTKDATFDSAGFYHVYGFGKYRFGGTLPTPLAPKTLYIWDSAPEDARIIETIRLLNGNPVLVLFDKK